jgi:single-strand DNA-binding protein
MPKSVNKVIILGNMGKDPEVKYTPQGTPVAKFSIATEHGYKDKAGNWQKQTEWHNVVAWARLAEICGEYAHKGDKIYIEGRLQTRSWDDQQSGQKKYMTEVVAGDIVLLGNKGGGESSNHHGDAQEEYENRGQVTQRSPITDEDIPFSLLGRDSQNAQLFQ